MLVEAAIGDAYGAGFEFQDSMFIKQNNKLKEYLPHGLYTEIYKKYTDDTQMAIAIGELMLEETHWTEERVANKFVDVFHRDKRRGYSKRIYKALDESKRGKDFLNSIYRDSYGNGAAMRAYPLGLIKDIDELLDKTEIQAKTTHASEEGILGAQRMALTVHYFLYINREVSLRDFIDQTLKVKGEYKVKKPVSVKAIDTTNAVISLVTKSKSMKKCLKEAVSYGGDTDSVAALCMAILSVKEDCISDLPIFLYDNLENDNYGRDFLLELDNKLKKLTI